MMGAEMKGDTLYISVRSKTPWEGTLYFDKKRHSLNMKLPVDWPRINQFPEWFTVSPSGSYQILDAGNGKKQVMDGSTLIVDGIRLKLEDDDAKYLIVIAED
jgi:hypothetical protein